MNPGRNDPCPCGSARKYNHCCGRPEAAPSALAQDTHEGAIPRAVAWLAQYHRKGFATALQEEIDATALDCFDGDEQAARKALNRIEEDLWHQIQINFTEWMLAEGELRVRGEFQQVMGLLLGPGGPLFTAGQRAWLAQLALRPLRLYDVTDAQPGVSVTLCDALDAEPSPVVVSERTASRSLRPGMQIGARLMAVAGGHELSGAIYGFSTFAGPALHGKLSADLSGGEMVEEDGKLHIGLMIIEAWLCQFLNPGPPPRLVHGPSGEALLPTTDHYELRDLAALEAALAAAPDLQGSRDAGWDRLIEGEDGLMRSHAAIGIKAGGERVSVLYMTVSLADAGRLWFEALAGDAVRFTLREHADPRSLLGRSDPPAAAPGSGALPEGIDPKAVADALAAMVKRTYANWADEPIPALGGKTPREAIATPGGLERVKGLLRSYEGGEARQAAQQGRSEISYRFLWDALGLQR